MDMYVSLGYHRWDARRCTRTPNSEGQTFSKTLMNFPIESTTQSVYQIEGFWKLGFEAVYAFPSKIKHQSI